MGTAPANSIALPFLSTMSLDGVLVWVYLALCVLFLGHWVVASYHWYVYGSERRISLLSIGVYGGGGLFLLVSMGALLLAM